MILYVYENYKGNRTDEPNTERLIALALNQYADETGLILPPGENSKICRTQKGKPYIEGIPVHISVSHSDHLWVCLAGDTESGVDIQNKSHSNFEAISKRFFQPDEQQAVLDGGVQAFIAIWCRKEAFIKYFGMTIGDTIDWLNVAPEGVPASQVRYNGNTISFTEIEVHPEFLCVVATGTKEEIWIRKIQVD